MLTVIIAIILMLLLPATLPAKTMKGLTIYEGLAGESVYTIFEDRHGLMWFGTTNGITCYDGYNTINFTISDKRSESGVSDIDATADGTLWAATNAGLMRLDMEQEAFTIPYEELRTKVYAIEKKGDTLYAGTDKGLFVIYNNVVRQVWASPNHVSESNTINDIKADTTGHIWVLGNYEMYVLDEKKMKLAPVGMNQKGTLTNTMRMMTIYKNRIFIGTYNDGVLQYDIKKHQVSAYVDVGCRVVTCLSNDSKHLYVGTDGAGLRIISLNDNRIIRTYSTAGNSELQLLDNTVYSFYRNKSGICFFGYFRRGVQHNYHVTQLFHCYRHGPFSTQGINVRSICIDGNIKVIGLRGGLYYIDEAKDIVKFFPPEELGGSIVTNVVKYNGQYYCCTFNGGVMRIDPNTLTTSRFGKNVALRTSSFGSLKVSPDNKLWMSGNAGVYIYDSVNEAESCFTSRNSSLYSGYANNLLFDRMGRCWISTSEGMCLYDPIDNIVKTTDFPKDFFNALHETVGSLGDKDNLVFSCMDGLYRTNEELTEYGPVDLSRSINDDYISQVIYDRRHRNYWVGTELGLFRFDSTFDNVAKYAGEVGLDSREFSGGAIYIDDGGRLWTGTVNGLYYADLDDIQNYSTGKTNIIMSAPMTDGISQTASQQIRLLSSRRLTLGYHWHTEDFSFMPLLQNFSDPEGLCYEYRIGDRGRWTLLKSNTRLDLGNETLHLGKNILQLRLSGQKVFTEYTIYVLPSWPFIAEWIVILFLAVTGCVAYRQRRTLHRQREEMQRVQRELEETKRKYSRINTSEDEMQRLLNAINRYMKEQKPYLDPDLRLSDIATYMNCSTVRLSQMFNSYAGDNFYDFVNRYRLEEFKRRIQDKRYAQYTLLALAGECGFRRSSFFATFKKMEGTTPTAYIKHIGK